MPIAEKQTEFGEAVDRLWKPIPLSELARKTELSYAMVHRIVRQGQEPTLDQAMKIAAVLNVSVEGLNGGRAVTK